MLSPPSVVKALRKLNQNIYIEYKRYEGVYLTEAIEKFLDFYKNREDTHWSEAIDQ
ncbi:helix-turn-helix domain-containing protein [Marinisporobacter balticus]|uniref:Uncharacterized protein n=1 Tax=Marinisporobacter balticus TaxID=2018667 RepID=A0A4R2LFM6_9FIRM|nr:hypothetical protein [Marinisporobacter balticus]TCO78065.1 hypothetical protein EV214_105164 [Marinisporobacter balticus]